jgi:transposase
MDIVHPHVAGIDVHKKQISVAVRLPGELPGERRQVVRNFKTFWRALREMADWLAELGVTDVAMEATGIYWWPVYFALTATGAIEVCVCNAAHMRNVPGRKTDVKDAQWIAQLHEHGLLKPSLIVPAQVRALRDRTRYRKKLIEQRVREQQRLSKVLETAGIKIDSVASTLMSKSGRLMIEALIGGERDPVRLADLAQGVMRRKLDQLVMACDGQFTAEHAEMCMLHLAAYDHLTIAIAELDVLVDKHAAPFVHLIARLVTIPGIGVRTAQVIVAETGGDMSRFPTPGQLAAWCGLAPANRESAGKRMRAGTRKGNQHLSAVMVEAAWSTARTKTRPGARLRRLVRRFGEDGKKKAAVAVAHTLLCIAWAVMSNDCDYREDGADFYDRRVDPRQRAARHTAALRRLGFDVVLTPVDTDDPIPTAPPPREEPAA